MNRRWLRLRSFSVLLPFALIVGIGCGGKARPPKSLDEPQSPTDSADLGTDSGPFASIRFAIEVDDDVVGPIYVLLNEEDDQMGWVKVFRNGERIYFRERCEIEDCGVPVAVCGAAIPFVKDIAGGGDRRTIEFVWDGMTSVLDPLSGCETRQPAPPGDYIARFCFSREAEFEGDGDPTRAVPGRVIHPTCVEKPFTLHEQQVVLRI